MNHITLKFTKEGAEPKEMIDIHTISQFFDIANEGNIDKLLNDFSNAVKTAVSMRSALGKNGKDVKIESFSWSE